jgi:hypothetical protein
MGLKLLLQGWKTDQENRRDSLRSAAFFLSGTEKGTDLFFYSKAALRVRTRVVKINLSPFSLAAISMCRWRQVRKEFQE